jgi:hypothetical protein
MPDSLKIDFCIVIFNTCLCFENYASVLFDFSLSIYPTKIPIHYSQTRVILFRYKMIHIKKICNVYITISYNRFLKYAFRGVDHSLRLLKIRPSHHSHGFQLINYKITLSAVDLFHLIWPMYQCTFKGKPPYVLRDVDLMF